MFVDVPADDIRKIDDTDEFVRGYFGAFLRETWSFGPPRPELTTIRGRRPSGSSSHALVAQGLVISAPV